jgi:hypothetical protein
MSTSLPGYPEGSPSPELVKNPKTSSTRDRSASIEANANGDLCDGEGDFADVELRIFARS